MKVQVNREILHRAVDLAQGVVDSRNIRPILQDIGIKTIDGGLELSGTNLDVGMKIIVNEGVNISEEGGVAIPANELVPILRDSPDETLDIEVENVDSSIEQPDDEPLPSSYCRIQGLDSKYRIAGDNIQEFPQIESPPEEIGITIEAPIFAEMIKKTRYSAADEATRYALNGVLFVALEGGKNIEMVGADGRRLAWIKRKSDSDITSQMRAILSLKSLAQMEKILANAEDKVHIICSGRQMWMTMGNITLTGQLVEGHYPNYEEVIPDDCDKKAVVNRDTMLSAVRRCNVVLTDDTYAVTMKFEPGKITVNSETAEKGSAVVELEAEYDGPATEVRFNPDYVRDFLRVSDDESVVVEFKESARPAIWRNGRNYLCLVMPITA